MVVVEVELVFLEILLNVMGGILGPMAHVEVGVQELHVVKFPEEVEIKDMVVIMVKVLLVDVVGEWLKLVKLIVGEYQ
jgi:hypothetical protein